MLIYFFQAEDGIRDWSVTGVQTCALPIYYNMLVRYAPDGSAMPDLAESWEVNDDATEWVFTLRDGVEFHNGKTLTADDVIYSLNLHCGDDTASAIKGIGRAHV